MTDLVPLGQLVDSVQAGFWGSDQPGLGSIQARVIRNGDAASAREINVDDLPLRWVTYAERDRARVTTDDVILVSSGDVGKVARVSALGPDPVIASNFVRRVRPAKDVYPAWLFHRMDAVDALREARRSSGGTALQNLSWSFYRQWSLHRPGRAEQIRIAEILDHLDHQLALCEQIEAKLEALREGLIVDLLTHGVHRHAAHLATNSVDITGRVIGDLPRGWRVDRLSNLLANVDPAMRSGPFGSALLKEELADSGVPLLGIDNVHTDRFVTDYTRFVPPKKARQLARYRVRPGDVMITIMGTVGRACVVPDDIGHALSSKHVWTMTFDPDVYLPYLISLQLNHAPWVLAQLRRDEQGGIMGAIRSDTLRSLLLPVPPLDEQRQIAAVLREVDENLRTQRLERQKLQLTKTALSADLFHDRVPSKTGSRS